MPNFFGDKRYKNVLFFMLGTEHKSIFDSEALQIRILIIQLNFHRHIYIFNPIIVAYG
jgi:hypothetical protein